MTDADCCKLIAELFTDPLRMDDVIRRSHAAVLKRHAAWHAPVIVWRNGKVERQSTEHVRTNGSMGEMPSMWVL